MPGTAVSNPEWRDDFTTREAITSSQFWTFSIATALIWLGILMAVIHLVPHATDKNFLPATTALALGISAAFNAFGRVAIGAVSNKIGTKPTIAFSLLLGASMLFWLIIVSERWMLYLFAICFELAYGGFLPQQPRVIVELFGRTSMGKIMGFNNLILALGPAIGPVIVAAIFDRTGGYSLAFALGGPSIFTGFVLIMLLKLPQK